MGQPFSFAYGGHFAATRRALRRVPRSLYARALHALGSGEEQYAYYLEFSFEMLIRRDGGEGRPSERVHARDAPNDDGQFMRGIAAADCLSSRAGEGRTN